MQCWIEAHTEENTWVKKSTKKKKRSFHWKQKICNDGELRLLADHSKTPCVDYFKAGEQPRGEHDKSSSHREIKFLAGKKGGWQHHISLCVLCLRAGGRPTRPDECAPLPAFFVFSVVAFPPETSFLFKWEDAEKVSVTLVQKPQKWLTHWSFITRGVTGMNVPSQAGFTLRWVNNLPKYFTFISRGWPGVNAHNAIFLGL